MILTDTLCDKLCQAAFEESKRCGVDISFAITDESGLLRLYRRFGDALPLSITLVPGKAYTASITHSTTEALAKNVVQGGCLFGINTADPRNARVTGGFPLFSNGRLVCGIGVGGGTEDEDRQIGEFVVRVFEEEMQKIK